MTGFTMKGFQAVWVAMILIAGAGSSEVIDHVDPYGCIMAGDWMKPFRKQLRKAR